MMQLAHGQWVFGKFKMDIIMDWVNIFGVFVIDLKLRLEDAILLALFLKMLTAVMLVVNHLFFCLIV